MKYKWSDDAQKIHGLTREFLLEKGVSQEEAAIDLASLILKYFGPDSKVMFLGHNAGFDISFTAQLLSAIEIGFSVEKPKFESWIQLHHVILDTAALGFMTLGLFKSELLFERIGFEARGEHNALTDAEQTLMTCAAIKQLVEIGLAG
jgi:DNA polymerase III epsilon subunit-like protein